jgi:hypothetical protein
MSSEGTLEIILKAASAAKTTEAGTTDPWAPARQSPRLATKQDETKDTQSRLTVQKPMQDDKELSVKKETLNDVHFKTMAYLQHQIAGARIGQHWRCRFRIVKQLDQEPPADLLDESLWHVLEGKVIAIEKRKQPMQASAPCPQSIRLEPLTVPSFLLLPSTGVLALPLALKAGFALYTGIELSDDDQDGTEDEEAVTIESPQKQPALNTRTALSLQPQAQQRLPPQKRMRDEWGEQDEPQQQQSQLIQGATYRITVKRKTDKFIRTVTGKFQDGLLQTTNASLPFPPTDDWEIITVHRQGQDETEEAEDQKLQEGSTWAGHEDDTSVQTLIQCIQVYKQFGPLGLRTALRDEYAVPLGARERLAKIEHLINWVRTNDIPTRAGRALLIDVQVGWAAATGHNPNSFRAQLEKSEFGVTPFALAKSKVKEVPWNRGRGGFRGGFRGRGQSNYQPFLHGGPGGSGANTNNQHKVQCSYCGKCYHQSANCFAKNPPQGGQVQPPNPQIRPLQGFRLC